MPKQTSENSEAREVRTYGLATFIAVGLALALTYFEGTPELIRQLFVPIAMLASVYLVFIAMPLRLARLLSVARWSSLQLNAIIYVLWAGALTLLASDFSAARVARTISELAAYINNHGFVVAIVMASAVLTYLMVRYLPLRISEVFALLPTLCGLATVLVAPNVKHETEPFPNLPIYLLLVSAVSASAYVANSGRARSSDET